jgi:acetyltransferase-like isoleucine patch superfamily enzyme
MVTPAWPQQATHRRLLKRLCKFVVKSIAGLGLRCKLLRWCGYTIGEKVYIGQDLIIIDEPADWGMVTIGDRAAISARVTLIVHSNPHSARINPYVPTKHASIVIGKDAWLGTGVVVMPGVTIGEGSVVGANSVVTRDVPPYTIVAGAPARFIREVSVPWISNQNENQEL